eukprot:Amastigsp_a177846_15.p4 type:complete len:121 gc:universal Amastigsp_a177846_15:728-366(-)
MPASHGGRFDAWHVLRGADKAHVKRQPGFARGSRSGGAARARSRGLVPADELERGLRRLGVALEQARRVPLEMHKQRARQHLWKKKHIHHLLERAPLLDGKRPGSQRRVRNGMRRNFARA